MHLFSIFILKQTNENAKSCVSDKRTAYLEWSIKNKNEGTASAINIFSSLSVKSW